MFGELVPKRIALQKSYEFAKVACGVIRVMATVLRPVIWLLSISVNGVLRAAAAERWRPKRKNVTEDEIRMMVDLMDPKADDIICDIKTPRLIQFNFSSADFAA